MGVLTFPVPGLPPDLATARRTRRHFSTTADGRIYRPSLSVRVTVPGGPPVGRPTFRWVKAQIDTGADCCIFAQTLADAIGLSRQAETHEESLRTGAGLVVAWFADVQMHLGLPTDPYAFDWTAPVGFVRDDILPAAFPQGIFGIGGGLERFPRIELVLSPTAAEMPVVRIYTPPA